MFSQEAYAPESNFDFLYGFNFSLQWLLQESYEGLLSVLLENTYSKKKKERMWANTYSKKINNINHLQNTTMEKAIHDILK